MGIEDADIIFIAAQKLLLFIYNNMQKRGLKCL